MQLKFKNRHTYRNNVWRTDGQPFNKDFQNPRSEFHAKFNIIVLFFIKPYYMDELS